jgi:hypothetical protein
MKLTGKCKESFEKWFTNQANSNRLIFKMFHDRIISPLSINYVVSQLTDSMKWGVYVDFFDSVGLRIDIDSASFFGFDILKKCSENGWYSAYEHESHFNYRSEVRSISIKKANEIFNSK